LRALPSRGLLGIDGAPFRHRMETTQVTERARDRLAGVFELEERGTVEVKGKGPMRTYLLVGRTPAPPSPSADGVMDAASASEP
jgi:hypothetical protein